MYKNFSKFFAVFSALLVFAAINSFAQDNMRAFSKVGKQPVSVVLQGDYYHIICMGVDVNFDGSMDDDDETPSWWRIPKSSIDNFIGVNNSIVNAEKLRDFDFGTLGFPVRCAFADGHLYIAQNGNILKYNVADGSLEEASVFKINANAISVSGDYLFASERIYNTIGSWYPDSNFVSIFKLSDKSLVKRIASDMNVQMTIPFSYHDDKLTLAILNEGDGTAEGNLKMVGVSMTIPHNINYNAGVNANFAVLSPDGEIMATVSNGSHKVILAAMDSKAKTKREIALPTTGFNGPREAAFSKDSKYIFVTAYDGNVYEYSVTDLSLVKTFAANGKVEGLIADNTSDGLLFACANINLKDSYAPNDTVTFVFDKISNVKDNGMLAAAVYPNPASDFVNIDLSGFNSVKYTVRISDMSGKMIKEFNSENEKVLKINLAPYNLQNGVYTLEVAGTDKVYVTKFAVVR